MQHIGTDQKKIRIACTQKVRSILKAAIATLPLTTHPTTMGGVLKKTYKIPCPSKINDTRHYSIIVTDRCIIYSWVHRSNQNRLNWYDVFIQCGWLNICLNIKCVVVMWWNKQMVAMSSIKSIDPIDCKITRTKLMLGNDNPVPSFSVLYTVYYIATVACMEWSLGMRLWVIYRALGHDHE